MAIYYLMIVIAAVGTAGNFALTKVYQKTMGNGVRESIIFNMFVGLFGSVFFWITSGFHIEFTIYSAVMALLMSLLVGVYTMIGFKLMSMGSMTVYTIFLMLGGAVVPYIYGVLFLNETVNFTKLLALLMIVAAVVLNSMEKNAGRQSFSFILLCFAVFFLNGAVSVVSKVHQIETVHKTVSADAFVLLKNVVRFMFFALILPFCGKKTEASRKLPLGMYGIMLGSAVVSSLAYMLQLIGASNLPATVLYPIVTGGTVVGTSLFDRMCFGQRLSRNTIISIAICVAALVLFVL